MDAGVCGHRFKSSTCPFESDVSDSEVAIELVLFETGDRTRALKLYKEDESRGESFGPGPWVDERVTTCCP